MKVLLFRSNNIFASRVNKYKSFFEKSHIPHTIIGWDKAGDYQKMPNYDYYNNKVGVHVGGVKAIINHCKWMLFVFKYLCKHKDVTTIHACDLNSAFPAIIYKLILNQKVNVIFDVCDWFSANFANLYVVKHIMVLMERIVCKFSNVVILCEPERIEQIPFKVRKYIIMPNIPVINESILSKTNPIYKFDNSLPTLAYFGGFADGRFLQEIIELSKSQTFNLLIAGYGDSNLEQLCKSIKSSNFRYFGKLNMKDGLEMSRSADLIYAMYCLTNRNHKYAAPNKFYEALFLGKPIITNTGTIVASKVLKYNIGYVINESISDLLCLIQSLEQEDMIHRGENAKKLWNTTYKDYIERFFKEEYSKYLI